MGSSTYNGFEGKHRDQVQQELNAAWRSKRWPVPDECVACGQDKGTIHGHLEDYSRPFTYIPLCIVCHLGLHMRFNNPDWWTDYVDAVVAGWQPFPATQRSGFSVVKSIISAPIDRWPGDFVNPPRRGNYLQALSPVKIIHPNSLTGAQPRTELCL